MWYLRKTRPSSWVAPDGKGPYSPPPLVKAQEYLPLAVDPPNDRSVAQPG